MDTSYYGLGQKEKRFWFTQFKVADMAKAVLFTGKAPSVVNRM